MPDTREPESLTRQALRDAYGTQADLPYLPASREPQHRPMHGYSQPPVNRVLSALLAAGCTYRPTKNVDTWLAECPCHDDTHPSLEIRRNHNGSIWLKDWSSQCSKEQILATLGLEWRDLWESSEQDPGRSKQPYIKPLLAPHLRRAMEQLIALDDARKAA